MKYIENEHYFNVIDSPSKAYILGFIAADGSLVKSSTGSSYYLTITIKYEDRDILNFIQKELNSKYKLLEIRKISYGKEVHHIRLQFSNKIITEDLMRYGILPRKSLIMTNIIENIPYEYRDAFIIGYFDGDGSISFVSNSINNKSMSIQIKGTYEFLKGVCKHLNITSTYIHQYSSIPQLSITHMKYIVRFFECYKNLQFYYIRKYNKFLERINEPSYDKYKQVQTISSPIENL